MYKYLNKNKENRYVNDCTVRAISLAERSSWDETYKKLSDLARKQGLMFDSVEFIEEHSKGTYLITMNGHISVCIDGICYDTFNCLDRVMRCDWKVR